MRIFGLVIVTEKAHRLDRKQQGKLLMDMHDKRQTAEAERDAANKQIERLLYKSVESALLWAAVRECGLEKQVGVVYERLRPKAKGVDMK